MNLSNDAVRLLRWLYKHDIWHHLDNLERNCKDFEYRALEALKDSGLVDTEVLDLDYENPVYEKDGNEYFLESYRISDAGKAYLESLPKGWLPEFREWIALGISLLALLISIIALVSE